MRSRLCVLRAKRTRHSCSNNHEYHVDEGIVCALPVCPAGTVARGLPQTRLFPNKSLVIHIPQTV